MKNDNRVDRLFADLRDRRRKALVAYVTGGYPTLRSMDRAARTLVAAGVDLLEIGVPFSDPVADGPTLQASSQKALEGGATLGRLLDWVKVFRRTHATPLVLMSYLNPLLSFGLERLARRARAVGVDGVIVPDLIFEEGETLRNTLAAAGVHLIYLVAPTTPPQRRGEIARRSGGFVYAVSLTGVTGARRRLPKNLGAFLADVRRRSPVPVAVGFGISDPAQARRAAVHADGVIVGSAVVERVGHRKALGVFVRGLRRGLDGVFSENR